MKQGASSKGRKPSVRRGAGAAAGETPATTPAGARSRRARNLAAVAAGALVAVLAGFWIAHRLTPPPAPVAPAAPEALDPDVRQLIERELAAARQAPRDAERHGRLGLAYAANSLWPEARASFEAALELAPRDPDWRFHRAAAAEEAGDAAAALELFAALAQDEPESAVVQQRLGLALLDAGRVDEALAAFRRLVALAPGDVAGHAGAAVALRLAGDPRAALAELDRALALDPREGSLHYQRGLTLRVLGREAEAATELARGLGSEPRRLPAPRQEELARYAVSLPARIERAEALRRAGRFGDAARVFEEALESHPDNLMLLNNLAATVLTAGDRERSRALLERALELDPTHPETLYNLAAWALAGGRREEALARAEAGLAVAPGLARLHAVRAQALVGLGRYQEAALGMEAALRLEPRDPALYLGLGVLYEGLRRWAEALALYDRALSSWPDLAPAHAGRATAALALGRVAAAREAVSALRELAPEHPRLEELERQLRGAGL